MLKVKLLLFSILLNAWINAVYAFPADESGQSQNDSEVVASYISKATRLMTNHPNEALLLLSKAKEVSMGSTKHYLIGNINAFTGNVYWGIKDYVSALNYFHSAIAEYKKDHDSVSIAGVYINISRVCGDIGDSIEDARYLKLAEMICPTHSLKGLAVKRTIVLNEGSSNFRKGRYEKALAYYTESLRLNRLLNRKQQFSVIYNNLAMTYSALNQDRKAERYADSALKEAIKEEDGYYLSIIYSTKADLALKHKEYEKATQYFLKSLEESKKFSYYGNITVPLYKDLYKCYLHLKDYKNALQYYTWYTENRDTVYSLEKMKQINEIEAKYKLEQKNATIAHLNRQHVLQSKLAKRQNIIIIVSISTLVLLALLMVIFIRYNRKVSRLNVLLREKGKRIVQQNKFINAQRKLLQLHSHKLENENTIAHFEILKNQVNPHMLFNALGVLKELIENNKKEAKDFVDDLSRIFRQALQLKSNLLITVEEELEFVKAYLNIISRRYENCINIRIDLPNEILKQYIPPFSLQLMLENVVKHNELDAQNPIKIHIFQQDKTICISNTVTQKRNTGVVPTGIGHQNLINRYKLVSEAEPEFVINDGLFSVYLPIFKDE